MGKKVLALIAGILLLAGICQAQPFLVCDPQPNVREYELDIDGTIITGIQAELDYSLKYPMDAWMGGTHNVIGRAKNIWGWGPWNTDPFTFNADAPGAPSGYGFSAE